MSEGITIALIAAVSSIIVALIGMYGLIKSAQIKNEAPASTTRNSPARRRKSTPTNRRSKSTVVGAFIVFIFSIIYLALSASTAKTPNRYIDMGSNPSEAIYNQASAPNEIVTFAHIPPPNSHYYAIAFDQGDRLLAVSRRCGAQLTDITNQFERGRADDPRTTWYDDFNFEIPTGCRIEITLQNISGTLSLFVGSQP